MAFAIVGLDHADALQVLVDHVVELVVCVEHTLEHRVHQHRQATQADGEHRNAGEEHQRDGWADAEGEDPRHNHHDRSAHTHADDHRIRVLQVGHIGGQSCDDRTGGETVDIGEAVALHLLKLIVTQILRESGTCDSRELSSQKAGCQRNYRANQQNQAEFQNRRHAATADALINQRCHDSRNKDFQHAFHGYKCRGEQTDFFVFAQGFAQCANDMLLWFRRCGRRCVCRCHYLPFPFIFTYDVCYLRLRAIAISCDIRSTCETYSSRASRLFEA